MIPDCKIMIGDVRDRLRELPDESVACVVTSPPYWALRDYGVDGQIGLEESPQQFLDALVSVFREIRRVLKKDGTVWCNMGDGYIGSPGGGQGKNGCRASRTFTARIDVEKRGWNLKQKDLVGMPWRLAFALQDDGWWLRQDIIWSKPNPMPESVRDRCTKAHEYIFLLSKSEKYYYNQQAIREKVTGNSHPRGSGVNPKANGVGWGYADEDLKPRTKRVSGWQEGAGSHKPIEFSKKQKVAADAGRKHASKFGHTAGWRAKQNASFSAAITELVEDRNKRSVWTVPTEAYSESHYATFPRDLVRPCILAGSRVGDTILDPFGGSGTTAVVALEYGRNAILIDINPENERLMRDRIAPFFGAGILPLEDHCNPAEESAEESAETLPTGTE